MKTHRFIKKNIGFERGYFLYSERPGILGSWASFETILTVYLSNSGLLACSIRSSRSPLQ